MDDYTPPPHPFAAHLRQHRVAAGLSQKRLAEFSGVSESWIRCLEKGTHPCGDNVKPSQPNPRDTVRLATVLEWELSDALAAAGHDPTVIPKVVLPSLEERIGSLTPGETKQLERWLDTLVTARPAA